MAEKSGFFNALNVGGEYDRTYNADDYSDNLAVVINNGVLRSNNDDLNVSVEGRKVTVAAGRAWINGHYYKNDSPVGFVVPSAPTAGSRYDRIMLRFDNSLSKRQISLTYVAGLAGNTPTRPTPTRSGNIYDLVIATIYTQAGETSVQVEDNRADKNLCGWVYSTSGDGSFFTSLDNAFWAWFNERKDTLSSVTLFKRYTWEKTIVAETNVVQFIIPQYDPETCFVEVYVNGIYDSRHTVNSNYVTFQGTLIAGTVVTVNAYKSIDGTGIESIADEITILQNQVATLEGVSNYTYNCTGVDDNRSISQIVHAFQVGSYTAENCTAAAAAFLQRIGGNTYLASLDDYAQITLDIVGKLGVSSAVVGNGTEATPNIWFGAPLSQSAKYTRKIVLDFGKCEIIELSCPSNTTNYIFRGQPLHIRNARIKADNSGYSCNITLFASENTGHDQVNVDNCDLEVSTSGNARIAEQGNFTNCICQVTSEYSGAYCFKPKSTTMIRLNGGTYVAYGRTAAGIGSAIVHTSASEADAVLIAQNIHCPTIARENYSQTHLSVANAGNIYFNVVVSRLPSSGSYNTIVGQINKSKA